MLREGHEQLGPVFWVNMGFGSWMLFCLGRDSYELYRNKVTTNSRGAYSIFGKGIGQSMIAHDGAAHSRVRSAMQPILSSRGLAETSTGEMMASVIQERVTRMLREGKVRLLSHTLELTLEIVLRVTGVQVENLEEWKRQYREFVLMAWPVPFKVPGFPRYRGEKGMRWLNGEILAMIRKELAGDGDSHGSLLHALVQMRAENGQPLTETELVDNIRVLYAAGHETTSSVLAWCGIELARHPEHWKSLCEEVTAQGWSQTPGTLEALKPLRFANAFFREVVRFHSPSWYNPRKTTTTVAFGGREIQEDTLISISPAYLARSLETFEQPDRFWVERWLQKTDTALGAHEISVFGGGPHFCVGYHLAWQETLQFLVTLVLQLAPQGLAPKLASGSPSSPRYVPFGHPHPRTTIAFGR